ncbi:RBBP9/YdeN family alpha/beta hydrolase [Pseudomonas sp. EL_65y_Pfl2_R95]|uniref:RBBP9/YdeN family alpha/beta hydrolase n=1 Tax=Pseudomonas sp. EL_65y_Pfl2_R95 TaxID=3088698 RepID=UPI0030DC600D
MPDPTIRYLIIPGWHGSAPEHWQSHWQRVLPNSSRVEQVDWQYPQQASWVEQLQRGIAEDSRPVVLITHSLGCVTVAHWAAQAPKQLLSKVLGALLVAPADVERTNCPELLRNFAPIPTAKLPFPSQLIGSDNDSAATPERALQLAHDWGSEVSILRGVGHINVSSGHNRWEQGFGHLYRLQHQLEQNSQQRA